MDAAGSLILGLGLFFLGMQQVGNHLRQLSGPAFRARISRSTGSRFKASLLGLVFGMLMQSATAVVFILVSMVSSSLIAPQAALPVITWTNVGLTALAFIVTLDIHPLIAYVVGLSAVAASLVRKPKAQAIAGVLLGIGLIFFGLQTMGSAARPLVEAQTFHGILERTVSSPSIAFLVGVALAAVLQSNTASALLVITLADAGAFHFDSALLLIYGTNLGAIALRLLLAAELRGTPLQLVRFEDLFCLISGAVMLLLYFLERQVGIPIVQALVTFVSPHLKTQLALAFFLSNLLPAIVVTLLQDPCAALLRRLWPATDAEQEAKPKFINSQAVADPDTAMDLLERELARLLEHLGRMLPPADPASHREAADQLSAAIEGFVSNLTGRTRTPQSAARLDLLRQQLSLLDYLRDALHQLSQLLATLVAHPPLAKALAELSQTTHQALATAVTAAQGFQPAQIEQLREATRRHSPAVEAIQKLCAEAAASLPPDQRTPLLQARDDFQMSIWLLHRLAKVLDDQIPLRDGK
jgi:phosphate:Na+ symporter